MKQAQALVFIFLFCSISAEAAIKLLENDGRDHKTHYDPIQKRFHGIFEYTGCDPAAGKKGDFSKEDHTAFIRRHFRVRGVNDQLIVDIAKKASVASGTEKKRLQAQLAKLNSTYYFKEYKSSKLKIKEFQAQLSNRSLNQAQKDLIKRKIAYHKKNPWNPTGCKKPGSKGGAPSYSRATYLPFIDKTQGADKCAKKFTKKFPVTIPFHNSKGTGFFDKMKKNGWSAENVIFTDDHNSCLQTNMTKSELCHPKPREIKRPGLGFDKSNLTKIKMSDGKIHVGNHTSYFFDHKRNSWCFSFVHSGKKSEGCYATTSQKKGVQVILPIQVSKQVDVKGKKERKLFNVSWLKLSPDGTAEVGPAKDQSSFDMYNGAKNSDDAKAGRFMGKPSEVDKSKGYMKFTASNKGGYESMMVQSYNNASGQPERTVNIAPRFLVGDKYNEAGKCPFDFCSDFSKQASCSANAGNPIDFADAGRGNLCYSCQGITNGTCMAEGKRPRVTKLAEAALKNCSSTPSGNAPQVNQ